MRYLPIGIALLMGTATPALAEFKAGAAVVDIMPLRLPGRYRNPFADAVVHDPAFTNYLPK